MSYKVAVNLSRYSSPKALQKGYNAVAGLDENANFPNLVVVVATMRTHLDTLRDAITEAEHGGDEEKTARDIARAEVNSDYRANGNYVNAASNGDKVKCESSGYELVQAKKSTPKPDMEVNRTNVPGEIEITCRLRPKGLISKVAMVSATPNTESSWELVAVWKVVKVKVSNRTIGQKLYVRIALVTVGNVIVFSEPMSIIVT